MIAIVSGLPGSGKSLNGIKQFLLPALKKGRKVYTNIEGLDKLAISLYLDMSLVDIEQQLICHEPTGEAWSPNTQKMKSLPTGCLVIVDEAQIYWNNRAYSSPENMDLLPHLQKHRHYGQDIIFLTQNIDQLDVGIRRLTQVHYRLAKLTNAGLDKTVKVKVFPDAMGSEQFAPMSVVVWKIDSRMFRLYKSYVDGVGEQKSFTGNVIFKNPRIIFALVTICVCAVMAWNVVGKKQGQIFAPSTMKYYDMPQDWEQYYCAEKAVYVLRKSGAIDTVQTKKLRPGVCPKIGHLEVN